MSAQKLPDELTSEQLEELLLKDPNAQAATIQLQDSIILFLTTFNIKPGKIPVHKVVIWNLYQAWKAETITLKEFTALMAPYLPKIQTNFYGTSVGAIKIQKYIKTEKTKAQAIINKLTADKNMVDQFLNKLGLIAPEVWVDAADLYKVFIKTNRNIGKNRFTKVAALLVPSRATSNHKTYLKVSNKVIDYVQEVRKRLR